MKTFYPLNYKDGFILINLNNVVSISKEEDRDNKVFNLVIKILNETRKQRLGFKSSDELNSEFNKLLDLLTIYG